MQHLGSEAGVPAPGGDASLGAPHSLWTPSLLLQATFLDN